MKYDEFEELYGKSWAEEFSYLCIVRSKKRDQERSCICNENKTLILNVFRKQSLFNDDKCCNQIETETI